MAVEENRPDQSPVVAPPDPLDHGEVLIAMETGGTNQHQPRDPLRMTRGITQDDLTAQARSDEVIGWSLDELVEEKSQPIRKVVDRDLTPAIEMTMECVPIVHEDLRHLDIEVPRQVHAVGEPGLRLLGQPVDEDQGRTPPVAAEPLREFEPSSDIGRHDYDLFRVAGGRTIRRDHSREGRSIPYPRCERSSRAGS